MRVLVVGGSGLVGSNVVEHCRANGIECAGTYATDPAPTADRRLDKTDERAVEDLVSGYDPDAVVDTAAFHDVEACETERRRAWAVNAEGTATVAGAADDADAHYVYLSTDYVFPGRAAEAPYDESDPVSPVNYYARTKYAGEQAARIADAATVLRPSVVYGLAGDNFLTWALGELDAGNEIDVVDDQVTAQTPAPALARAIVDIVRGGLTGLYHATGPGSRSRYEFTRVVAGAFDYDVELLNRIGTEELGWEAPRPADSTLDSSALYRALGWEFPDPGSALAAMRDERET